MDKKDLLGIEMKSLMEEDTNELKLSSSIIDNIMNSRKITLRDKLNNFLNKEVEIPLAPALIGFAALLAITIIPKDIFKIEKFKIIEIGSSQVIVRNIEVSRK